MAVRTVRAVWWIPVGRLAPIRRTRREHRPKLPPSPAWTVATAGGRVPSGTRRVLRPPWRGGGAGGGGVGLCFKKKTPPPPETW
ncbi:hypothetical protein AAHZ94_09580 [Streptomyces sp. HSW2009]